MVKPGSPIFTTLARSSPKWEVKLSAEEERQRQHRPVVEHQQQHDQQQQGGEQQGGGGVGEEEGADGRESGVLSQARLPPACFSIPGHLQGATR